MKISLSQFASTLEVNYETMRSYLKGRAEPGSLFFRKLNDIYPSADIGWILTGRAKREAPMEGALPVRRVPVLRSIPAGGFVEAIPDELILDYVYTPNLKDTNLFGLIVEGDSMSPEIEEGDFALFAPDMDFVNGHAYAILTNDSEATLKKVFRSNNGWTLIPANPKYDPIFIAPEKVVKLYKLIEVVRRYNGK